MALVDSSYRFIFEDVDAMGNVSDVRVFKRSKIWKVIMLVRLPASARPEILADKTISMQTA